MAPFSFKHLSKICAFTCVREKLAATTPFSKPSSLPTESIGKGPFCNFTPPLEIYTGYAVAGVSFAAAICYFGEKVIGRNKPDVSFEIQQTKLEVQALKEQVDRLVLMFDAASPARASSPDAASRAATTPASPATAPPSTASPSSAATTPASPVAAPPSSAATATPSTTAPPS